MRRSATGQSCASPPVSKIARRRPLASASAWIFAYSDRPASGQPPAFAPPFSARRRAVRLNMCGVDHLGVRTSTIAGKLSEQVFPYAATGPTHEAVIERGWRTIGLRTIAPSAAAPQHVHNPAHHSTIIHPWLAANIGRQMRLDPHPLLIVKPKQPSAHLQPRNRIDYGTET